MRGIAQWGLFIAKKESQLFRIWNEFLSKIRSIICFGFILWNYSSKKILHILSFKILHKKKFRLICQKWLFDAHITFSIPFQNCACSRVVCMKCTRPFYFALFYIFLPVCKWDSFLEYPDILICKMSTKCQITLWNRRSTFYMCPIYNKWGFHLCIGCKWPDAKAGNAASFLFSPFPKNASNLKVK